MWEPSLASLKSREQAEKDKVISKLEPQGHSWNFHVHRWESLFTQDNYRFVLKIFQLGQAHLG